MLANLKGVGEKTLSNLSVLGINSVENLINNIPKSYIDLSSAMPLGEAQDGCFCLVDLFITEKKSTFTKGRLKIFKAFAKSENKKVTLIWYNQNYISKLLEENNVYTFYGKISINRDGCEFVNPLFEEKTENSKFKGIKPVYHTKGLINQKNYWNIVIQALKNIEIKSIIPQEIEEQYDLMPLQEAYRKIHIPHTMNFKIPKERLLLESVVKRIAAFNYVNSMDCKIEKFRMKEKFCLDDYKRLLPFKLNISQIKALEELSLIIYSGKPLNAILCGDVGSGKTIIAFLLALYVVENGFQTAIMAPTEILANQHFNNLCALTKNLDINIAFLSSSVKARERQKILDALKNGYIDILIGTHSIISKDIIFENLAFAVMDEQHRFGVAQRTRFLDKGKSINVLTLSATPIPRSLQLVAYGEIDYVTIKRRFTNNTVTAIVPSEKREDMWCYLYVECIEKKQQAFIVAPQIFDSEGIERENVENLYKELGKYFPKERMAVLHGKLSSEKKQNIVNDFNENIISILISTTVVEVGIDVPDAGIMVIMNAESFGLATLHQLRGRVGRNGEKAYCFLYTDKESNEALKFFASTDDGMEIAEKDFNIRGSGDILGLNQSGTGLLQGITLKTIITAKEIVEKINIENIKDKLKDGIEEFSLNEVSFT